MNMGRICVWEEVSFFFFELDRLRVAPSLTCRCLHWRHRRAGLGEKPPGCSRLAGELLQDLLGGLVGLNARGLHERRHLVDLSRHT